MFPAGGLGLLAGAVSLTPLFEGDSRLGLLLTGGGVVDGAAVEQWVGRGSGGDLLQDTAGNRPVTDDDLAPGRFMIAFADGDHLTATLTADPLTLTVVFDADATVPLGDRVLITRDTSSGATSKAAFEVALVAYFG